MPQFISEGTERTLENPTEGSTVQLVVRVKKESLPEIEQWISSHDGTVTESLEHGLLEAKLREIYVSDLCDLKAVRSVERADENIQVLTQGN